ncbi:MAG: oligopeptide ABC transporter ATP-binding protein OppD, partial [Alphaproteobacteria bacterium]|nr:oligopeptide ABC transporter ATP-binding protein OppD [Alphaproteobacteria bacterium]
LVMYAGRKVEEGPVAALFARPLHPYTRGLLDASDWDGDTVERLREIPGVVPPLDRLPPGCSFAPRCPVATPACGVAVPEERAVVRGGSVACIRAEVAPA